MSHWNRRRVLVTGGNGFIGSHLVEQLLQKGAAVTATASSEATQFRFLDAVKKDIRSVVGDLRDPDNAARAVYGQQVVMQLAARVGGIDYNSRHHASLFHSNMLVFLSVIEAARVADVENFVVTSSACVYPRFCSIPTPEAEGFSGTPEPTNEGYGWAKRMEEYLGAAYAREYKMHVRIARPFNAYGPRDDFSSSGNHVIPALIRRVVRGDNPLVVWGRGSATRNFLYVSDLARGLMAVAEKSSQVEAINIGGTEETCIGELARTIIEVSGQGTKLVFDDSKPEGQPRRACDTTLAKTLLNFETEVTLRDGLARTLSWYRENAHLFS